MKQPPPQSTYLFPVQVAVTLVLSVTLPGLGLLVAGALSTTRTRMNVFANIATVSSGVLGLKWSNDPNISAVSGTAVAVQAVFHTFAGAFLICFGVFLSGVCGSIAMNRFLEAKKGNTALTVLFAVGAVFLMTVGFNRGYVEAYYATDLAATYLQQIENTLK